MWCFGSWWQVISNYSTEASRCRHWSCGLVWVSGVIASNGIGLNWFNGSLFNVDTWDFPESFNKLRSKLGAFISECASGNLRFLWKNQHRSFHHEQAIIFFHFNGKAVAQIHVSGSQDVCQSVWVRKFSDLINFHDVRWSAPGAVGPLYRRFQATFGVGFGFITIYAAVYEMVNMFG